MLEDPSLAPEAYVKAHVDRFMQDVSERLGKLR